MADPRRYVFQDILEEILGSKNVYFNPPPTLVMKYPCIVYHHSDIATSKAGNRVYNARDRYDVTIIDKNPDSDIPHRLVESPLIPLIRYDRSYIVDNLNHYSFQCYF